MSIRHCLGLTQGMLLALGLAGTLAGPARPAERLGEADVAALVEIAAAERQPEGRRAVAIRQLENTDQRTHLSLLRRLLREERSPDIRLAAACTLAAQGDHKSPRDLLFATAYDGERTASCSHSDVIVALGRLGDPAAAFHLDRALRREAPADEPYYYAETCRALAHLRSEEARSRLILALRDGSVAVRYAAVSPLASLCLPAKSADPSAVEALRKAAHDDPEERVAEQATSALLWSAVDGAAFFRMLESDHDPRVRARAARIMDRHFLSPARLARLRLALTLERDPGVREAIEATLRSQTRKG